MLPPWKSFSAPMLHVYDPLALTVVFVSLFHSKRPNENVFDLERRQPVAKLDKSKRLTRNLLLACNQVSVSTIPTRNERPKRKCQWHVRREESRMAKRISILVMAPVSSSSRNYRKKFRKQFMVNEHLKSTKRKKPELKSRARLRCNNMSFFLFF